jgi:FkbM family methyltransferase
MKLISRLHRMVFARPSLKKLNLRLFHISLHGLGILNYQDDVVSGERYLLRKWLPKVILGPKPIFFDVGANEGQYTDALLQQFPTAFVHAFEPHPVNYSRILQRAFPSDRVKCQNLALGDAKGSLTLYDHAGNVGSSHASVYEASITEFHEDSAAATTVEVETLDNVTMKEGIGYIDFLKIDTEGHELAVLSGASRLLREGRIGHIQFEFNALHVYSRVFFRDFRNILANYNLYRLLPAGILPIDTNITDTEIFAFQNVLAAPKPGIGTNALRSC